MKVPDRFCLDTTTNNVDAIKRETQAACEQNDGKIE